MMKKIKARFREPSTYAALAALLAIVSGENVTGEQVAGAAAVLGALGALAGIAMKEKGGSDGR